MAARIYGDTDVTFGLIEPEALRNLRFAGFPPGAKIRLRVRNDEFLQAFSRVPGHNTEWWYVSIKDGLCTPSYAKGMNLEVTNIVDAQGKTRVRRRLVEQA